MYDLIRKIHFYLAALVLSFLVMYFLTGYPMIHEGLLDNPNPRQTTRSEALQFAGEKEPAEYALYLQKTYQLRGKREAPQRLSDGSWRFRYVRPGTLYEAIVSADGASVRITESRDSLRRTLIGFHRLHGYGGGLLYDLWAVFYDLASLSLIVFAVTGVYMWYKLTARRLLGWILLGSSFAYSAAMVLYLVYAP